MEFKNSDKLQILTAKTFDLHRRINEKINEHGFSFCSHCSNHGRYCVVADDQSSPDEREKMIAIRDSLKDLHTVVISLQNVRSTHKRQMEEALGRVEESRKEVRERVKRCSKEERENLDVIEEVIEFVGDGKSEESSWEMDEKMLNVEEKNAVNRMCSFLFRTMRFGLEFVVVFASIYMWTTSRQQNRRLLQRNVMDSRIQTDSGVVQLDVLCGRG